MINVVRAGKLFIGSILLCISACNDDSGAAAVSDNGSAAGPAGKLAVSYEMKEIEKEVADESSPLGYWEVRKSYPVFSSAENPAAGELLNERVDELIERYSCSSIGEETFSVDNVFIGERVFSMQYEAMWMCAAMPSPNSAAGTLNVNLADGGAIVMQDQFISESEYDEFTREAVALMRKKLETSQHETGVDCPTITTVGGFYVSADNIVIESPRLPHGESSCEVEVSFNKNAIAELLKPASVLR